MSFPPPAKDLLGMSSIRRVILLAVCALVLAAPVAASAAVPEYGQVGDLAWGYDGTDMWILNCPTGCPASVVIPDTILADGAQRAVTKIEASGFILQTSLTSVTIPPSVKSIGDLAFYGTHLASIDLPDSLTDWGWGSFAGIPTLTSVRLPATLRHLPDQTFVLDPLLTAIELPAGLETIGSQAFRSTGLASIDIPASVTGIGECAFANAPALTTVTFSGDAPTAELGSGTLCAAVGTVSLFEFSPDVVVRYVPGTAGWGATYAGRPTQARDIPGTPPPPTAVAGNRSATVTVAAAAGATPTSYTVTASPGGATCTITGAAGSCTFSGLTNGTPYTFTAVARASDPLPSRASPASAPVTPSLPLTIGAVTSSASQIFTAVTPPGAGRVTQLGKAGSLIVCRGS
ncbi:MAG: leucine-rich repeat protein, partial [Actinobacteria bacterium]|nr:leucine-rich repeat protein [Actinomycetota bacterium]